MSIIVKEICPSCFEELKSYHITKLLKKRKIIIYWECLKCKKEFKSIYKIKLESIEEILIK